MGCTFSTGEALDHNPRIFKVINVDDQGGELNPGKIEITEADLILYQRGKDAIRWPLKSLRRYGFDAELFSFESGRRCPTGPGIYAFKCRRAEALFNLLQECIQRAGQEEHHGPTGGGVRGGGGGNTADSMAGLAIGRPGSLSDTEGPFAGNGTPLAGGTPLMYSHHDRGNQDGNMHPYINGDVIQAEMGGERRNGHGPIQDHEYVNTAMPQSLRQSVITRMDAVTVTFPGANDNNEDGGASHVINYAELDLPKPDETGPAGGLLLEEAGVIGLNHRGSIDSIDQGAAVNTYMNIDAAQISQSGVDPADSVRLSVIQQGSREAGHNYANLDLLSATGGQNATPKYKVRKVNYIQLDLKNSTENLVIAGGAGDVAPPKSPASPISLVSSVPDSPSKKTESYATIDFNKTAALSNSAKNAGNTADEGFRKTRHNSNIEELN